MTQQRPPTRRANSWFVFILIIIVLIVIWLLFTRDNNPLITPDPTPVFNTNVLSPAPAPVAIPDNGIIFQDNFDHSVGDWELSPIGQASYTSGVMFLEDSDINGAAWARPHLRFQDFILDVDSRWLGGSVGGSYGVRIRLTEDGDFVGFYLHNDGRFTIVQSGTQEEATLYEAFSQALSRAGEANHFHIEAVGDAFRFFVNGNYLVDVQLENAASAGDIMFVAQKAEGTDFFRVGYDNLIVGLHPGGEPVQ